MAGIGALRKALEPTKGRLISTVVDIREIFNSNQMDKDSALTQLGKLKKFLSRYEYLRAQLGTLSEHDETEKLRFEEEEEESMTLILDVDELQIQLETYLNLNQNPTIGLNMSSTNPSKVKLTKLDIKKYNGDILEFSSFWQTFENTVDKNDTLSNVEKFCYLKGLLIGDAEKCISGLSITSENYSAAITLLKNRFFNQTLVKNEIYKKFRNLPRANNNTLHLRKTFDEIEQLIRSLQALKEDITHNSFVSLIMSKFPSEIVQKLEEIKLLQYSLRDQTSSKEENSDNSNLSEVDKLRDRLELIIKSRELSGDMSSTFHEKNYDNNCHNKIDRTVNKFKNNKGKITTGSLLNKEIKCHFCKNNHWSDDCTKYTTTDERKAVIKGNCFVCLRPKHTASEHSDNKSCVHCKKVNHHHRSLCPLKFGQSDTGSQSKKLSNQHNEMQLLTTSNSVHLQTATVTIADKTNSNTAVCRTILDSGSQRSYISSNLVKKLNLVQGNEEYLSVCVFGATKPKLIKSKSVEFVIHLNDHETMSITANVIPMITLKIEQPSYDEIKNQFPYLKFGDKPELLGENKEIDLLLGNDYFFEIVTLEKIKITAGLYLISTKLGWILSGRSSNSERDNSKEASTSLLSVCLSNQDYDISVTSTLDVTDDSYFDLQTFWDLEVLGIKETGSITEDDKSLQLFSESINFRDGRYHVSWPWKDKSIDLNSNYGLALGRLRSTYKRLCTNRDLMEKYNNIILDQLKQGVIEEVTQTESDSLIHYLPHHAVLTPSKTSTKVRIVYDASARTKRSDKSLNDCLLRGRVLLGDLVGMLLRSRFFKIMMVSDIEKAFLQIGLNETDRDVTRFLWIKDINKELNSENLITYRFCRVAFGIISSPFLLQAVILYHLNLQKNSVVAQKMSNNIYMDNVIIGLDSTQDGIEAYNELKCILNKASMNLREWNTNDKICKDLIFSKNKGDIDPKEIISVLGILWNISEDTFSVKGKEAIEINSKRSLLKYLASIFDPMGFVSPLTVKLKLFLKQLWVDKMDWDSNLNDIQLKKLKIILNDLKGIHEIKIPRYINSINLKYDLHCFTDASKDVYGTVIYIVEIINKKSFLLFSKVRLSPPKNISIPRLELLGILLGSRCLKLNLDNLECKINDLYLWSDSKAALFWLMTSKPLPVFVERRIKEIKNLKSINYRFVPGIQNPADIITRGTSIDKLSVSWWHGPSWLTEDKDNWPEEIKAKEIETGEIDMELENESAKENVLFSQNHVSKLETKPFGIDHQKFSSLKRLIRVTALCRKFINKLKGKKETSEISAADYKSAEVSWILWVQLEYFKTVISDIKLNKYNDLQRNLGLFLDEENVLKCRGRLENAQIEEGEMFPKLLPNKDHFTKLVILDCHSKVYHLATESTLAEVRRNYWIPRGRALVKGIIRNCLACKKFKGQPFGYPNLPPLPAFRVTKSFPFQKIGLDYFGPLWIRCDSGEKEKVYCCLFTCLVTRAAHIEMLGDMSTEQFLLGIRRFIARRGEVDLIISDNAATFKSAKVILDKVWNKVIEGEEVGQYCSENKIEWKFIAEFSPWMGGVYERIVKIIKNCLKVTLGRRCLTIYQLQTVLTEVETIINSRPLVYVGEDGVEALTPAHFLTTRAAAIQLPRLTEKDLSLKKKILESWRKGNIIMEEVWNLWKKQYLANLRERQKFLASNGKPPKEGDIVLVEDKDTRPRQQWKLGRILSNRISKDGMIRSAIVKVEGTSKEIIRPVCQLYPLEV